MGDARRAFDLYTEQKLALGIERPRLAAGEILLLINAPDRAPLSAPSRGRACRCRACRCLLCGAGSGRRARTPSRRRPISAWQSRMPCTPRARIWRNCQALKATLGPSMPLTGASTMIVGVRWPELVGPPSTRPRMYSSSAGHVEGAVLHADIDVVGPGLGVLAALLVGQHVAGMRAVVVDRLVGFQQLDGAVDALGHGRFLRLLGPSIAVE